MRPYQREGLGWPNLLDEFGFGGFLADAIVSADNSLLQNLTAEDLQLLLD